MHARLTFVADMLCLQPDETHIAAGMSDGTLSVRRRNPKASEPGTADALLSGAVLRAGTFESFLGGALPAIGQGAVKLKGKSKPVGDIDEFRVESKRKRRLREYDKLLKGFKYSAALDSVLRKVRSSLSPHLCYDDTDCGFFTASTSNDNFFAYPGTYPP
jgi:U3 small nucleolar RNA-associated protein 15